MGQPLGGQLHGKRKQPVVAVTGWVCADHERTGPPKITQPHRRGIRHFGAQNVGQVFAGLGVVKVAVVVDNKIELELTGIVLRGVMHALCTHLSKINGCRHLGLDRLFVGDFTKVSLRQCLQRVQRQVADQRRLHQIGAVILLEKGHH